MFTKSDKFIGEYCAQIVIIGKFEHIENSDFLVKTLINGGYQVVVGKNDVKEGDVMVYCKLETSINKSFLSISLPNSRRTVVTTTILFRVFINSSILFSLLFLKLFYL